MATQPYLIQAEFFLVGKDKDVTLEELYRECLVRALEGSRIKTVVRFFDINERVLVSAVDVHLQGKYCETTIQDLSKAEWWRRWYFSWKHRRGMETLQKFKLKLQQTVFWALKENLASGAEVGIEKLDRRFRALQRNEMHEVLESASSASNLWVFIFHPNDLFSDTNKTFIYVM